MTDTTKKTMTVIAENPDMPVVSFLDTKMNGLRDFTRLLAYDVWGNDIPLKKLIRAGNLKIPKSTAIFNMSSARDCPALKLGLCKAFANGAKCYAMKAEVPSRPGVKPFRDRQEKFWLSITAEEFAVQFLTVNSLKPEPFTAMRLNEAGDFHTQECVTKAEKIARILKKFGVVVYGYTSRDDLDFRKLEALRLSGSGFKKEGIVNIFKIIQKAEDKPKGYVMCPMDCRICDRCSKAGMKTVVVKH